MDKSWVKEYRFSEKYELGVENFLSFAIDNSAGHKFIPCPCSRCVNLKKLTIRTIRIHLFKHGFSLSYTTWIWHGENNSSPFIGTSTVSVPTPCSDSEMFDMCEAAFKEGYYGDFLDDFHKFVKDGAQPLYKNSENSKLESLVKLQYLKARYGMSRSCFSEMLSAVGSLLQKDNVLPKNVYESKKIMNALGLKYEKIHACPNDCILYRKEYADVVSCPKCGLSRWKLKNDKTIKDGQPAKILWYFPIISRFKRLFSCPDNAEMLTWHEDSRSKDGQLRHPADSPSWKLIDYKWPEFANDSRNLRLGFSADGINPHSTMSSRYSCWPVILVTYNLPPWLCMKRKFMMLTLLISGPKQPGNDIDVYLKPLIDDLRTLWDGVSGVYDAYRKETFTLRAVLLWTINDFPAYGNLSGCTTKGYKACPICGENTSATYLPHSRKLSYASHRKFLPHYHPYRKQKRTFNNQQELGVAPTPLRGEELLSIVENINYVYGKGKKKKNEERCAWKKKSIFFDLDYWQFLHVRHNLDVMHIEKNICESLVGTLLDIPSKTKHSVAARLDMIDIGVRIDLGPTSGERRTYIPAAPYTLSKQEKFDICNSLLGIKVPDGYSSNINNLVSMEDLKLYGLKSHDCHTLMQQLLHIAIRSGLPKNVRISIMRLCFFFNALCSKVVDVSKLDKLQSDLVLTLCELEKIFPPSFFDIMVHLSVHLVREVRLCGPVFYRWMYPFERYMKVLKGYVKSRIHPEGCIAESYIAEEAVEFCSNYSAHINAIGIPKSRDNISGPISRAILKTVDEDTLMEAHLHVLFNNAEVDPYITKHKRLIEQQYAGKHKSGKWLQNEQNTTFADWFQSEVLAEIKRNGSTKISETLRSLSGKPRYRVFTYEGYIYNGVKYFTKQRDNARVVQNSGVSLVAKTMQVSGAKDKNPVECDMTFYGVIEEIWELDYLEFKTPVFLCDWVENEKGIRIDEFGFTLVNLSRKGHKSDKFASPAQLKQVFYVVDPADPNWSVVLVTPTRDYRDSLTEDLIDDLTVEQQPFCAEIPMPSNEDENETATIYKRDNVQGFWVDP